MLFIAGVAFGSMFMGILVTLIWFFEFSEFRRPRYCIPRMKCCDADPIYSFDGTEYKFTCRKCERWITGIDSRWETAAYWDKYMSELEDE